MRLPFRSQLFTGYVVHRRERPITHAFRYRVCYYLFDVDELPELNRRLVGFGYNRHRPIAIFDSDYGRTPGVSLRQSIEQFLSSNGVTEPIAHISLLTQARTFGYVFNPVSYFYCSDADDHVRFVVAEVNNTFGDRIRYLLDDSKRRRGRLGDCYRQPKAMHVSPFMPMLLDYRWYFWGDADRLTVHMDEMEGGERFFQARLSGRLAPLTNRTLWRAAIQFPLMPVQIIAQIHWQALRLWWKQAPYYPRPPFRETFHVSTTIEEDSRSPYRSLAARPVADRVA